MTSHQETVAVASKPKTTGRIILESEEELKSTPAHQAIVWGCTGLLALLAAHGIADIDSSAEAMATLASVVAAYYLAGEGFVGFFLLCTW